MKKFISLILPCFIAPAMGFAQIELKSDDQSTVISFGKSDETS